VTYRKNGRDPSRIGNQAFRQVKDLPRIEVAEPRRRIRRLREHLVTESFGLRSFEFIDHGPFKLNGERLVAQRISQRLARPRGCGSGSHLGKWNGIECDAARKGSW
jgi:hypothetical protein